MPSTHPIRRSANHRARLMLLTIAALILVTGTTSLAEQPELVSVHKIWDKGQHNAFTDLIRFNHKWYCTFREAEDHVGGDGKLRVLESSDGTSWHPVALIEEQGIDLRDPKLSITPDNRLMIVAGGSVYRGTKTLQGRRPRVMFSNDARTWTAPEAVLGEGDWLWRVTWHDGRAYGAAYKASGTATDWLLNLYSSADGVHYEPVCPLEVRDRPNETTLRFLPDGEMLALVRRETGNKHGMIGSSRPPYRKWNWHEIGYRLGGPNFIQAPDGSLWAGSRLHGSSGPKTALARMTRDDYRPVLTLPSGGDTSYPGMVWHDDLLWMSYYSSHEGKTSIYLAKIRLRPGDR